MIAETVNILNDALCQVLERQPVDVGWRVSTLLDVMPFAALVVDNPVESEQMSDIVVRVGLHSATTVVNNKPIGRAHELARDHERTDRVVARAAARITDDMRIALAEPDQLSRVHSRIHAGQDCQTTPGGADQLGFVAKTFGTSSIGFQNPVHGGV